MRPFLTEEQFEAYRALGFHAAHGVFAGRDRIAISPDLPEKEWQGLLRGALARLDLPEALTGAIVARQAGAPPWRGRPRGGPEPIGPGAPRA